MKKLYSILLLLLVCVGHSQNSASLDTSFQHVYLNASYGSGSVRVAFAPNGKIYATGINASENLIVDKIVRFNSTGSIDASFNKGSGFPNYGTNIYAIALQNDNKIIVGGQFSSYNNTTAKSLVRINEDGSIDSSFDVGLGANNGYFNPNGSIRSIKILENGKILCAGDFRLFNGVVVNNIVRLNPDGSLDTSFSTDVTHGPLNCVQFEPATGNIYIAGHTSGSFKGLRRLNSSGQIDPVFNIIGSGFNAGINDIAVQIDGKIIAVGLFTALINNYTSADYAYRIVRLNPDGSRDATFNAGFNTGVPVNGTLPSNLPPSLQKVLIKNDGKVLVCGEFTSYNESYNNYDIAQLNNDGSTDIAFNSYANYAEYLTDLALQNDNKIIVGGTCNGFGNNIYYSHVNRLTGMDYYLFKGVNYYDSDLNGCNTNDLRFNDLRFNVSSTLASSNWYPSFDGANTILFKNGSYTITPVFENPSYFNASPSSVTVNFPSQLSPVVQNFCITPNGVHPDLELTLLPITPAVPGFNAKYKLVYKNKGTHMQSGTVGLSFNDAVLDFISSVPAVSSQVTNSVSWNFTNLNPCETREVVLTLNLNAPTETPPLSGGAILNYTATVASAQTDETPNDNTFVLNQTVVNSFDPNDKTCLQGTTVGMDKVGEYVHYIIRFENTGTYNAKNITVTDFIDTNKFDIATLIPVNGSHLFITKITDVNKVEFVFENINLPYADATNDGYVAFKIKTKSTLVSGDTFSNGASIYFDYNSAINTNNYTTTIQTLSNQDFSFANYFSLYPNPVNDVLNINKKEDIEITSIHIYNVMGQLMMVIPNAKNTSTIDVSNLASGNYFVKINSDKGTSNTKFIKK